MAEEFKANTKVGRPNLGNFKHGFYVNKMKPCSKCPKFLNKSCPYFYVVPKLEHLHKHMYDEFGVNRCVPEYAYFQNLIKTFKETYDLGPADMPLLEKMVMIMVRAARVEEYIADQGLTQIRTLKDDKTGELKDVEVQNLLKKDAYFDDKMLREWLENLKISRRTRKEISDTEDLAIVFTTEKRLTIKGKSKEKIKEAVAEVQQSLTEKKQDL